MADGRSERNLGGQKPSISEFGDDGSEQSLLPKIIKFSDLARCGDEIWIECESQLYRLRKTKQGKLILTK